jgi:hypothetical protein
LRRAIALVSHDTPERRDARATARYVASRAGRSSGVDRPPTDRHAPGRRRDDGALGWHRQHARRDPVCGQAGGATDLKHVSWEGWFEAFDARQLNVIYQERKSDGAESNFFRLESPNND